MRNHGIQISRADQKAEARPPEAAEIRIGIGAGLCQNGNAEALRLQHAGDDGGAEGGMVDIGIAADIDKIGHIPPKRAHLFRARGQKRHQGDLLSREKQKNQ